MMRSHGYSHAQFTGGHRGEITLQADEADSDFRPMRLRQ